MGAKGCFVSGVPLYTLSLIPVIEFQEATRLETILTFRCPNPDFRIVVPSLPNHWTVIYTLSAVHDETVSHLSGICATSFLFL